MRAFIAVPLNEQIKEAIAKTIISLRRRGITLVSKEKMHFTLKFLGDVTKDDLDRLKEALKDVKFRSFFSVISGKGVFPNMDRPRVLWLNIKDGEALKDLARLVSRCVDRIGIKTEDKKEFSPHLTIARIKSFSTKFAREIAGEFMKIDTPVKELKVDSFQLVITRTDLEGWPYEVLEEYKSEG